MVCEKMGFTKWQQVSGQTYTRKLDYMVLSCLSGLAQSAYKMCGDIRLLASMKEIGEYKLLLLLLSLWYLLLSLWYFLLLLSFLLYLLFTNFFLPSDVLVQYVCHAVQTS